MLIYSVFQATVVTSVEYIIVKYIVSTMKASNRLTRHLLQFPNKVRIRSQIKTADNRQ